MENPTLYDAKKKFFCFMENNAANDTKSKVKADMTTLNGLLVTR